MVVLLPHLPLDVLQVPGSCQSSTQRMLSLSCGTSSRTLRHSQATWSHPPVSMRSYRSRARRLRTKNPYRTWSPGSSTRSRSSSTRPSLLSQTLWINCRFEQVKPELSNTVDLVAIFICTRMHTIVCHHFCGILLKLSLLSSPFCMVTSIEYRSCDTIKIYFIRSQSI